jgi:tetratricopeptide (TPR) repeat protein
MQDTRKKVQNFKHPTKIQTQFHSKSTSASSQSILNPEAGLSDQVRKGQKQPLPIPKGETPYALAKIAEYKDRDLDKAELYYKQAIRSGERVISAIKDLASLMHQRGKTKEALTFLNKKRHLFKYDKEKFDNLCNTLEKQLNASSNSLNKNIKISGISSEFSDEDIKSLFENPVRIKSIQFGSELDHKVLNFFCIVKFNSHSSARKTLEGFRSWEKLRVQWIGPDGQPAGDAHYYRQKMQDYRKEHPTFDYQVFDRDPHGYVYCLPLDSSPIGLDRQNSEQEGRVAQLLGNQLFKTIFNENCIECY